MVVDNKLIDEVKEYVTKKLSKQLPEHITYHSMNHTFDVVASASEIAYKQGIKGDDLEILTIAAWFHDLGYTTGFENHEIKGAEMAKDFLIEKGYPKEKIKKVVGCIMATQMPQSPNNTLEQVLCDADLLHLAQDDYFKKADLLHKEIESTKLCKISEKEWLTMNQEFLHNHCFFTDYAKSHYESAVKENLRKVRERLKSWQKVKK